MIPVDYDEIGLERIEPGRGFLERSTMLTQRLWEHERTIEAGAEGAVMISDRLAWEPRLPLPGRLLRPLSPPSSATATSGCGATSAAPRCRARLAAMALADDFQRILDALPPDWTDLELDLRIDDERQYIDSAVALSQVNAQVYNHAEWHWRLLSPTASATPPRRRRSRACWRSSTAKA